MIDPDTNVLSPADVRVRKVEILISTILRVGVTASLAIVMIGTVLSFVHHPDYVSSQAELRRLTQPGAAFPHTPGQVWRELRLCHGQAIVVVGLLLLVATPVVRVAVSIFTFAYQRDRVFVLITFTVLALLIVSFVLGKVEG